MHVYDVKPASADVNLIYNCPKCGASNYVTPKEAKFIQRVVCGGCEAFLELKPIERINIKIEYQPSAVGHRAKVLVPKLLLKKEKDSIANSDSDDLSDVLSSLINLGYKRKEATARIEKAVFILGNSNAGPEMVLEKALTL